MEKLKITLLPIFVFFSLGINAQTKKPFIPTKGEIVFIEKNIITDKNLFFESQNGFSESMIRSLEYSLIKDGHDSLEVKKTIEAQKLSIQSAMEEAFFQSSSNDSIIHKHVYDNNIIKSATQNDFELENIVDIIDIKNKTVDRVSLPDSIKILQDLPFYFSKKTKSLQEFKKEKRNIAGFQCFKIVYEYYEISDDEEDEEYANFAKDKFYTLEIWVTNEIKSSFHPIIKEKQILEKYYPLEILETDSTLKGLVKKYSLLKISLQ